MESPKENGRVTNSSDISPEVPVSRKEKIIRSSTKLSEEKFSYTWKLSDFDEIPFVSGYPIYSPTFYISKNTRSLWQIAMTKHTCYSHRDSSSDNEEGDISGSEDEDEPCDSQKGKVEHEKTKRIGLRLLKLLETPTWDVVRYLFTVKCSDGTTVSTTEREEPGQAGFRAAPLYSFLVEKDLKQGKIFNEKNLEVTCDITYSYVAGDTLEAPVAYDGKQFVPDLRVLFVSNKFSDLLINVNREELQAHKLVLHAGAPGLGNVLEDLEKPKTKLDLGLDSEVGKAMVNFLYSGKIVDGFPLEKCKDLIEAARRYGVECLEQYCSAYFLAKLPSDICRVCLSIDEDLNTCLKLIKLHGVEEVKRSFSNGKCCNIIKLKKQ